MNESFGPSSPLLNILSFPEAERDDIFRCSNCLNNLDRYCRDFSASLELYVFSVRNTRIAWAHIAARDGAMSIYHFAKSMDGANTWAHRSASLTATISREKLHKAFKSLRDRFPRFEAVRHAVAHAAEITKSPKWLAEHSFSGSYEANGIKIENATGIVIQDSIFNNVFTTTYNNQIQEYEISHKTLNTLVDIKETFYQAFINKA